MVTLCFFVYPFIEPCGMAVPAGIWRQAAALVRSIHSCLAWAVFFFFYGCFGLRKFLGAEEIFNVFFFILLQSQATPSGFPRSLCKTWARSKTRSVRGEEICAGVPIQNKCTLTFLSQSSFPFSCSKNDQIWPNAWDGVWNESLFASEEGLIVHPHSEIRKQLRRGGSLLNVQWGLNSKCCWLKLL